MIGLWSNSETLSNKPFSGGQLKTDKEVMPPGKVSAGGFLLSEKSNQELSCFYVTPWHILDGAYP